MRRLFFVALLLVALAGTTACEEQREFEGTPILVVKVNGQDKTLARVPMDLLGLEKKLFAMSSEGFNFEEPGGGGGAPFFSNGAAVNYTFSNSAGSFGTSFGNDDTVVAGYYSSDSVPTYFAGGGTCNFASEACAFAKAICQHMGPIIGSLGGDADMAAEGMAECMAMDCGAIMAEAGQLIDEMFSAEMKCAMATILSCVTPQVPAMAGALAALGPDGLQNEAALQSALTPIGFQVAGCLGPYMAELEAAATSLGGDGAGSAGGMRWGEGSGPDDYSATEYTSDPEDWEWSD